ncbi:membrane dipeptidase [Sphingomonas naasensis]|uniref:Membrane dipeptidase n=1 Tax=Sphingomonas naasensis TaxID=1344951 RepID=A0A4S1WV55_9SPHN|nr:dipeptidase [Sphingomonas naasensis]NIJ19069.1 membrane dipeptidase [Sphingomonas naasensis]TGX46267.1 membrane dipeptidase [Sphingomonas naasensis]
MKKLALLALLAATASATSYAAPGDDTDLHKRLLTLDTHLDTPAHFSRPGWNFGERHDHATDPVQVDLGRMDAGDLDGGFFVIYTASGPLTPEGYAAAKDFALRRADEIHAMLAKFPGRIALATKASDAARLDKAGKRFAFISIENSYPLGEDLSLLGEFYRRGVRMASPVHFRNNQFADSATNKPKWNGLSPLGRQWVAEMNRLGMVLDASHASDAVLDQMIALSKTPVILSHSGSKAIFDHARNLDDARLRRLAASGGAICANAAYLGASNPNAERSEIADKLEDAAKLGLTAEQVATLTRRLREIEKTAPSQQADFETYMRLVLHLIEVAGVDHVCFGADWDGGGGVPGFEDIDALPKVTARLRQAGYSAKDIEKMWSGNVLRLVRIADEKKGR